MNKEKELEELKKEAENCKRCSLWKTRKNVVFGYGDINSEIMFIGEAPGKSEDEKGIPFCGRAGRILDFLFSFISFEREKVYITNLLKCRPPKNRNPKKEEIEKCKVFLEKQIKIINPKIICTLGKYSTDFILKKFSIEVKDKITEIHGKVFEKSGKFIIPTFHPALAIYNPKMYNLMKEDFKKILRVKYG